MYLTKHWSHCAQKRQLSGECYLRRVPARKENVGIKKDCLATIYGRQGII